VIHQHCHRAQGCHVQSLMPRLLLLLQLLLLCHGCG
jgi:hypothetical protein